MKKAQIKMAETMGILVIFFLLLVFGFTFWGGVERETLKDATQEAFELRTIDVAQMVLFMPELQCTEQESVDIDCIDAYKLHEFLLIANDTAREDFKLYYFNLFGKSKITLYQVYPPILPPDADFVVLYDNFGLEFTRKLVTQIPVSIFNPVANRYAFGYLKIEVAQ